MAHAACLSRPVRRLCAARPPLAQLPLGGIRRGPIQIGRGSRAPGGADYILDLAGAGADLSPAAANALTNALSIVTASALTSTDASQQAGPVGCY